MALHGRRARLLLEYEKLLNLEKRSDFIKIQSVNKIEGMPPEEYIITFTCRGIVGLNPDKTPHISDFHQVSMKLSSNFPNQEPYLKWLTPIWHPNIEHKEPHHVCTDNVRNWYASKSLGDLVISLGKMVQYRHYHAEWTPPFPLDKEAADWVINFAEPNGFVKPDKPIDDRPILRPLRTLMRPAPGPIPKPSGKLRLGIKKPTGSPDSFNSINSVERQFSEERTTPNNSFSAAAGAAGNTENLSGATISEPVRRRGITLGLRTKEVVCIRCYETFTVPSVTTEGAPEYVCNKCRDYVKFSQ